MSLPTELRLEVYKYLVPDRYVVPSKHEKNHVGNLHLRYDKLPCSPALLRTNHQIYDEIIDMWYGTATFEIYISRCFYFLDLEINDRNQKLPASLRRLRSVSIFLYLDWQIESERAWTELLAGCFSAGPYRLSTMALHQIKWHEDEARIIRSYVKDGGRELSRTLSWNLDPLQMLRGVSLTFENACPRFWHPYDSTKLSADTQQSEELLVELHGRLRRRRRKKLEKLREIVAQTV
jgi:hypothetical protein